MFKSMLFVAFCIAVLADCKPMKEDQLFNNEIHRVARAAQQMPVPMKLGEQLGNAGMQVAAAGLDAVSNVAHQVESVGAQITDAVKTAMPSV